MLSQLLAKPSGSWSPERRPTDGFVILSSQSRQAENTAGWCARVTSETEEGVVAYRSDRLDMPSGVPVGFVRTGHICPAADSGSDTRGPDFSARSSDGFISVTDSGRDVRRQSDFGITYVALRFPFGRICPDGRTARLDERFRTLRAPLRARSLAHRVLPFFCAAATASARHEHLEQTAAWTPLPRHAPAHRGDSTGPRRRPRITGGLPRERKRSRCSC